MYTNRLFIQGWAAVIVVMLLPEEETLFAGLFAGIALVSFLLDAYFDYRNKRNPASRIQTPDGSVWRRED